MTECSFEEQQRTRSLWLSNESCISLRPLSVLLEHLGMHTAHLHSEEIYRPKVMLTGVRDMILLKNASFNTLFFD